MTKKSIILKQSKAFLELQQSFGEVKQKLIQMYAKDNNTDFINACVNLDNFQLQVTQDFLTYITKDTDRNVEEFNESIYRIKHYLKKFHESTIV